MPPVARPTRPGLYEVVQRAAKAEIIPGTTTEIWGYDGRFPGPTFSARRAEGLTLRVRNELPAPAPHTGGSGGRPPIKTTKDQREAAKPRPHWSQVRSGAEGI
nr:hypothetical protein GCM10010200_060020 [Actinomadura rugatobispora]